MSPSLRREGCGGGVEPGRRTPALFWLSTRVYDRPETLRSGLPVGPWPPPGRATGEPEERVRGDFPACSRSAYAEHNTSVANRLLKTINRRVRFIIIAFFGHRGRGRPCLQTIPALLLRLIVLYSIVLSIGY